MVQSAWMVLLLVKGAPEMEALSETCRAAMMEMEAQVTAGCRPAEAVMDTPDRTSSEDEQHNPVAQHVDVGLPPIAPVKAAAKASLEGIAAAKDQQPTDKRSSAKTPVAAKKAAKMGKVKTPKKVAVKAERVDRRRKRKTKGSDSTGISQASAMKLFQCSCQLLRTQTLDYDVRAREMEDRNAAQAKEIDEWEKRIRSLKRELEEYVDEQPRSETTGMALIEAKFAGRSLDEQANPLSAVATAAVVESSLPPTVIAAEAKLQEELRKRTHKVNEFCRSVSGFIESLDEQTPHHF